MTSVGTSRLWLLMALLGLWGCTSPLRAPSRELEKALLSESPLGSSREDVLELCHRNGRQILESDLLQANSSNYPVPASEGASYLRVSLGSYRPIFTVDVTAVFIFDKEDRLVSVHVRKDTNAL